jgi:dTDP-4-dehydrorhamnose 3,5-epimerase-like enzyme
MSSINDCKLIHLPKTGDRRGNITPVTSLKEIPFQIKRIFYLYDIPGGESRGAHAHIECHQFLVSILGSFEVELDDGYNKRIIKLDRSYYGLYIPPMIWASEINFSSGSICLTIASHLYDPKDYVRDYNKFKESLKLGTKL